MQQSCTTGNRHSYHAIGFQFNFICGIQNFRAGKIRNFFVTVLSVQCLYIFYSLLFQQMQLGLFADASGFSGIEDPDGQLIDFSPAYLFRGIHEEWF